MSTTCLAQDAIHLNAYCSMSAQPYLDGQSLSEIAKAIVGISRSEVEETVERVIAKWKKAAKQNPTDPVSAMVKKER